MNYEWLGVGGHDNNIIYFLSSGLSLDFMSFKKSEWELEDNQVHTKYYIFNDSNNKKTTQSYFMIFSEHTLYSGHCTRGCKYREKQDKIGVVQIELGLC